MKTIFSPIISSLRILFFLISTTNAQWLQSGPYNNFILAFESNGTKLFTGSFGGGVYLSSDNGANWIAVIAGLTNAYVSALTLSGNMLFAGTDDGVFVTTNNGTLWTHKGLSGKYVQTFAVDGAYLYAGTFGDGAFVTTNNGTNWTAINSGLNSDYVICTAAKDSFIFAGTWGGGVSRSSNHGANWTSVNSGLTNLDVRSLAVIDTNLFAGTYGGGVFLSKNNGNSWAAVNDGLSNKIILPMTTSGTNLFAGTSGGGVFLTTDYGVSWAAVNEGLTNLGIAALKVMGTKIFAGTVNTGNWRRPLSELITDVEREKTKSLDNYFLSQNLPNPFNSTTTISFGLATESLVTLIIYNTLGKEVGVLISEDLPAGIYNQHWDAAGLASGIYFYKLSVFTQPGEDAQPGSFSQTKKLILLK